MRMISRKEAFLLSALFLFVVVLLGTDGVLTRVFGSAEPVASVEVGVATLSPLGELAGFSIPASAGSCTRCAECDCTPPPPPPPPPGPTPPPPPGPTPPPPGPTPPPPPPPGPPGSPPPPPPRQCADFVDNDSDGRIDAEDPACHSDGNSANNDSYDPNIDTEVDLIITADPRIIRSGDGTTVIWQATGTPLSCTVEGPGVSETGMAGEADTGPLTEESFYTLACDYGTFERAASVRVVILPAFEEF